MARSTIKSVGTTATLLGDGQATLIVQNLSAAIVYVGGPTVTADTTATGGLQLPASNTAPVTLPPLQSGVAIADTGIYARVASGTANVSVLSGY
jgi:hypothetical protein